MRRKCGGCGEIAGFASLPLRPSSHTNLPLWGTRHRRAQQPGGWALGQGCPLLAIFISSSLLFIPTLSPKAQASLLPRVGKTEGCPLAVTHSPGRRKGLRRPWGPHQRRSSQAWALGWAGRETTSRKPSWKRRPLSPAFKEECHFHILESS